MERLRASGLLTDSYHFSMIQAYLDHGLTDAAVFEFFVRKMPRNRGFLVAAGLEQVLDFVINLRFTDEDIEWLSKTGNYRENLIAFLKDFRFSGDIAAMPEGTVFFPNEPIMRVKASLPHAQLLETRIINILHYQTLVASKAARCALFANGKFLVEFGLRRAHGAEAGLWAARASYLAGFHATSDVLASKVFGIPISGTMAHSFIEAHADETEAFEHFAASNPQNIVFLLDTYDTLLAARKVASIAPMLKRRGYSIRGVRLDSGDLVALSRQVRAIFDDAGLDDITIFASGGIDESKIQGLLGAKAPIDGFGVGTPLVTSEDAAFLDSAYKLVEYAGQPRRKRSDGKATLPGAKQVFRFLDDDGNLEYDVIALEREVLRDGIPLLLPFIKGGTSIFPHLSLIELRKRCLQNIERLPQRLRSLTVAKDAFDAHLSADLRAMTAALEDEYLFQLQEHVDMTRIS